MNILLIGDSLLIAETQTALNQLPPGSNIAVNHLATNHFDLIIDTDFDLIPETNCADRLATYATLTQTVVMVGAVRRSLSEAVYILGEENMNCCLAGFNNWPTFINRPLWEVSLWMPPKNREIAAAIFQKLGMNWREVNDRVGLVTPRIVGMIINEACYTLQEGTATIADIDRAMQLGVNYPDGPFSWANKIGLSNVYQTLAAVYNDTHDERYKICPLLKTHFLQHKNFAV